MSNTIQSYQRLKPCVDSGGHRFATNPIAAGNFGHAFIYCTRCGKKREELT